MPVHGLKKVRQFAGQRVFFCVIMVLAVSPARAQTIPDQDLPAIQQKQDSIQRRHSDDVRQRGVERREFIDKPPDGMQTPRIEAPAGLEDGACADIDTFDVKGAELISIEVMNVMTGEYAGRCLMLEQINTLLADISNWYLDRGYVTTRAYLPPQDLTTGTLQIVVVEGRTQDIRFSPGQTERGGLATAFPELEGQRLNIRDLEQGLDQLNRLPSNNAKLTLEPGEKTGETVVVIENAPDKRMRFTGTEDNTGSRATGLHQRTLEAEVDDLLGINDMWSVSYKHSLTNFEDYGAKNVSGSLSVPYGYWTFEYSDSWFLYASTIEATTDSYKSTGSSRQSELSAERVVHRDQDSKTSLEGALTLKQGRNFIAETLLESQSRKLSIGALTLHHADRIWDGALSGSVTYNLGLRSFGAKKDHEIGSNDARAQFKKWSFNASYSRPLPIAEQALNSSLALIGQWTPHTLFSSERISIGGLSSVRGFKEDSLSGDVGGYGRTELSWTLPGTDWEPFDKTFGRLTPYGALDAGWIKADPGEVGEGGVLAGWTLGLRASSGVVSFDVAWAEPLKRHHNLMRRGHELYTSLSIAY